MKKSTRSALVVLPFVAFGLVGVGVTVADRAGGGSSKPSTGTTQPPVGNVPQDVPSSYATLAYDAATVHEPTRNSGQSKLWFNDGSWWGVLLDTPTGEFHIHWLEWATQTWHDTGVLVDERNYSRADVLWDGAKLHIASSGSSDRVSHEARIVRFSYDPAARRYSIDPNFPVAITDAGTAQLTIAKDSAGRLWVSYIQGEQAFVAHSLNDDSVWGDAFPLPSRPAASTATRASVAAYGTEVGVMWTSAGQDAVLFTAHDDGAADDTWTTTRTAIEGLAGAENDLSLQVFPEEKRVFATVKTSVDSTTNPNNSAAQVLLLELQPDGRWRKYLFGRVSDHHAHPLVVVDREARRLYLFATAPARGGAVYYKQTSLDDPSFPTGTGVAVISSESPDARVDEATSTKQVLDRSTGLVAIASDDVHGRYHHGVLDLGGPAPGQPSPGDRDPKPAAAPVANNLVNDDFNSRPVGGPIGGSWSILPVGSTGSSQIVATPSDQDRSARVSNADGATDGLRLCRAFAPTTGDVTVAVDVQFVGTAGSEAVLTSVRGGAEAVSVRFGSGATFVYNFGTERVKTDAPFAVGVWYRSVVVIHPATRTFDWEIRARGSDAPSVSVQGVAWRSSSSTAVNQFCVAPPDGAANGLLIDNVRVSR